MFGTQPLQQQQTQQLQQQQLQQQQQQQQNVGPVSAQQFAGMYARFLLFVGIRIRTFAGGKLQLCLDFGRALP